MTYWEAAKEAARVGYAKAEGLPLLAVTARTLADAHPGLSAHLLYDGAVKLGVTPDKLRKMSGLEADELMWA